MTTIITQVWRDKKCVVVLLFCLFGIFTIWKYNKRSSFTELVRIPDRNKSFEIGNYKTATHSNSLSPDSQSTISSSVSPNHVSSQFSTTSSASSSSRSRAGLRFSDSFANALPKIPTSNTPMHASGDTDASASNGFYQVSDNVFIYSAFIDRRFGASTVRLIGMQDKAVASNISCVYRLLDEASYSQDSRKVVITQANSFSIFSDWPSPNVRYQAYAYACHTPKYWFNVTNPDCLQKSTCGVAFSVLSADRRYETEIPLTDEFYFRLSQAKETKPDSREDNSAVTESDRNNPRTFTNDSFAYLKKEKRIKRTKNDVLLCVKAVYGQPSPSKLTEWIEFNRELGVNKIVFYDVASVGEGKRVLDYYSKTAFVDVVPFHFALQMRVLTSEDPYQTKLQNGLKMLDEQTYLVALNDCFYRHLGQYRYVLVIDWDEMVIPTRPGELIAEMADRAVEQLPKAVALMLSTAWHFDKFSESPEEISAANADGAKASNSSGGDAKESKPPPYLHMQNHLMRTPVMKASQPKPIIIPYYALSINWHSVTRVPTLGDGITRSNIPVAWQRYGFVHHFRKDCKHEPVECGLLLTMGQTDEIIPRYRSVLQDRVGRVIRKLKIKT